MDQVILGNSVGAWLFSIAAILVGLISAKAIGYILKGIAKRTNRKFLILGAEQLQAIIVSLGLIMGARVGFGILSLGGEATVLFSRGFSFLVVFLIVWAVARCYDVIHTEFLTPYCAREDTGLDSHLLLIFRIVARSVIWVLGLGSALSSSGFDVTAIIAGLGIGGLAIALASQDTVSNIFGGLIVLTQRPFKVGDRIKVAGHNGWVHDIGLRVTSIDNWYGRRITIPNKVFTDGSVENIDTQACYYEELRLRLEHGTKADQVERAMTILNDIILECPDMDEFFWMGLDGLVHGCPEIDTWYAISLWKPEEKERNANWYSKVVAAKTFLNLEMMRRFEKEGLRLALPLEARILRQDTAKAEIPEGAKAHIDYMRGQQASPTTGVVPEPPG